MHPSYSQYIKILQLIAEDKNFENKDLQEDILAAQNGLYRVKYFYNMEEENV